MGMNPNRVFKQEDRELKIFEVVPRCPNCRDDLSKVYPRRYEEQYWYDCPKDECFNSGNGVASTSMRAGTIYVINHNGEKIKIPTPRPEED